MSNFDNVIDREKQTNKQKIEPPKNYHVFILNDDYSTYETVITVCMKYFRQTASQAERTAMDVHTKGKGLGGTYPRDIAETKAQQVSDFAQLVDEPLRAIAEQE